MMRIFVAKTASKLKPTSFISLTAQKELEAHVKTKEPVLIVGGGIAGLTFARSCEIAKIPYLLFERRSEKEANPLEQNSTFHAQTGIGLWGPGERIINSLGIGDNIRAMAERMSCAGYRTQNGEWLAQPPIVSALEINTCITLSREDLVSELIRSIPKEKVIYNHEFVSYRLENKPIIPHSQQETQRQSANIMEQATTATTATTGTTATTLIDNDTVTSSNSSIKSDRLSNLRTNNSTNIVATFNIHSSVATESASYSGSILVAADGIHSPVRKLLYPHIKPKYCGYAYYRAVIDINNHSMLLPAGHVSTNASIESSTKSKQYMQSGKNNNASNDCATTDNLPSAYQSSDVPQSVAKSSILWYKCKPADAWETWGVDNRIAYVPLKNNKVFWFVSHSMPEHAASAEYMRIKQLQSTTNTRASTDNTVNSTSDSDNSSTNDRYSIAHNILNKINAKLAHNSTWHDPIPTLISSTPNEKMIFTPIYKISMPQKDTIRSDQRVVLIGDAAHAVPPNLASGAMMSMQDAVQLGSSLKTLYYSYSALDSEQNQPNYPQYTSLDREHLISHGISASDLDATLKNYLQNRKIKVKIIQYCSDIIASIGQLHNKHLIRLRDSAIQCIPMTLRNFVFTRLHKFYLGGSTYTVPDLGQGLYSRLIFANVWKDQIPLLLQHFHSANLINNKDFQVNSMFKNIESNVHVCSGDAVTYQNPSIFAKLSAFLTSMPHSMDAAKVSVEIEQLANGREVWTRTFTQNNSNSKSNNNVNSTSSVVDRTNGGDSTNSSNDGNKNQQIANVANSSTAINTTNNRANNTDIYSSISKKGFVFKSHQYIENESFVEAIEPWENKLFQLEVIMKIEPIYNGANKEQTTESSIGNNSNDIDGVSSNINSRNNSNNNIISDNITSNSIINRTTPSNSTDFTNNNKCVGFSHRATDLRLRFLPYVDLNSHSKHSGCSGGFTVPIPDMLQPRVNATTIVTECGKKWNFDVKVSAMKNKLGAFMFGSQDAVVARYTGTIDHFTKKEVEEWMSEEKTK